MKLRRFTDAVVAKTRAYLAAVKESNDVDAVMLDGEPFTRDAAPDKARRPVWWGAISEHAAPYVMVCDPVMLHFLLKYRLFVMIFTFKTGAINY